MGFGGRVLDESGPKYINTQATQVFDKRRTLYGLDIALNSIRTLGEVIIVEGYMDVIAAHEFGFSNVIASMGTALTGEQVGQLRNYASSYVLALDEDQAGMEATIRSLESAWKLFDRNRSRRSGQLFASDPLNIKVLRLPSGKDPDDFIRTSPQDWENVVSEAVPVLDFLVPIVIKKFDLDLPGGKGKVIESLYPILTMMDPFDRDKYVRVIADAIRSDEKLVQEMVRTLSRQKDRLIGNRNNNVERFNNNVEIIDSDSSNEDEYTFAERQALFLILSKPKLRAIGLEINAECFRRPDDKELFSKWSVCESENRDDFVGNLEPYLKDRYDFVMHKAINSSGEVDLEIDLRSCIIRMERRRLFEYRDGLISSQSTDSPPSDQIQSELMDLDKRIRETFKVPKIPF